MLRRRGLNVVLKTTIMKPNYDQADAIFHLAQELGATNYRTTIEVTPRNDGNPDVQVHQLSDEQMLDYLLSAGVETPTYQAPVAPEQAREKGTCGTGTVACYISPYGDVYPCIQLLISMGNIRERSFREIWEAPSALRTKIESIQRYGDLPDCRTCEYVQFCQRCHGLAYLETGDFTKCYKLALRTAKISKQVNAAVGLRRHATITTTGG
jgi:radical SAM protein with 4Fe4S-binding SPASM domain